ncbi:MAG: ammonium transporter [Acidobacteria bacterium]|nr:ammonium transporter [Acidobacteriota bacterium]
MSSRVRAAIALAALVFIAAGPLTLGAGAASAQEPCGGRIVAGDPCGDKTGGAADVVGSSELRLDQETFTTVVNQVGKNKIAVNFTWLLLAGALVLFFQTGFALVETGLTRAKNAAHTMMMNFVIFAIGGIAWYLTGFALMFGGVGAIANLGGGTGVLDGLAKVGPWGIFGTKGFAMGGIYDVGVMAFWFFQLVFMDTAGTIVTGAMAERWKWSAFVVYSFFMAGFLYPLFGNWAWGGGWLAALGANSGLGHGYVDFAGSGVVHAVGGLSALAGAMVIGPRIGKYGPRGEVRTIPGHNLPMAITGVFILLFGWLGFNAGSTLGATDLRIAAVVFNTVLASCAGALAAMFYSQLRSDIGKPDPGMTSNGMLAGLVAITAPSGFVAPWAALVIGVIAGILVVASIQFFDRRAKLDDPVGAISVHGVCGLWGVISVGLFADGTYGLGWNAMGSQTLAGTTVRGLFYGDVGQLWAQLAGVATLVVWAFGLTYLFMKAQKKFFGIRVSKEAEIEGLDMPEMGTYGYPEWLPETSPVLLPVAGGQE